MKLFHLWSATLVIGFGLSVASNEAINTTRFTVARQKITPFRSPSPNVQASHVLNLKRQPGTSKSSAFLHSLRKGYQVNGVYGVSPLIAINQGQTFLTDIDFAAQSFEAIVDTGSSDTWIVGTGFQCEDFFSGANVTESECAFGATYDTSSSFELIPNEYFNIIYGDGEVLTGTVGRETVTVAGITVQNQQVAIVETAAWVGDGVSSGLIGLGFPAETSAYYKSDPSEAASQIIYNPLFTNMYTEGYVSPLFSLAIERSTGTLSPTAGGQLAIGGLPPVSYSHNFASAPFELLTMNDANSPSGDPQYLFYAINASGFVYSASQPKYPNPFGPPTTNLTYQVIIDSGTTLALLPTDVANAVNALFVPPAVYNIEQGDYVVDCSATPPTFGVRIASQTFFVNGADMIIENGDGTCASGVTDAGDGPAVLGDVFLKNVLAVFDVGASEMRFAARKYH